MKMYAEYEQPEEVAHAISAVRAWGAARFECYSPFASPVVEQALGAGPSHLSRAVFVGGLAGAGTAYFLQWLLNAYLYPLDVGGRPPHFPLAFVPITFEMGVLIASWTAVIAVFVLARLVKLWHPSRDIEGIESSTRTRWWLEVTPTDPHADLESLRSVLRETGPHSIQVGAA